MTVPRAGLWEDYVDVFVAPAAVITRRQGGNWLIPTLIVVLLLSLMVLTNHAALAPVYDAQFAARAQHVASLGQGMSETEIASAVGTARTLSVMIDVASVPVTIFLFAAVVWIVGRMVGVAMRGEDAIIVAAYASVLDVVAQVSRALQALTMGADRFDSLAALSLGPARLLSADAPPVATALANQLDPLVVWKIVIAAIGICVLGRIAERSRVVTVAALLWLGTTLPVLARSLTGG